MYKLTSNGGVIRLSDGAFVPNDEGNIDHQAYLAWKKAGNKPKKADAVDGKVTGVTRAQGKAILIVEGLLTPLLGYVASVEDYAERALIEVFLNDVGVWERDSPSLAKVQGLLKLTDGEMDALFAAASQIRL